MAQRRAGVGYGFVVAIDPNPYAPPRTVRTDDVRVRRATGAIGFIDGDCLVVPNGEPLPPVCLKCGVRKPIEWRRTKFFWAPPWAYAFFALFFLPGAVIVTILQKSSWLDVPLCPSCNARWRTWGLASVVVALSILPIFAFVFGVANRMSTSAFLGAGFAGIASWIVVLTAVTIRGRRDMVVAKRIEDGQTWLGGVHRQAMRVVVDGW